MPLLRAAVSYARYAQLCVALPLIYCRYAAQHYAIDREYDWRRTARPAFILHHPPRHPPARPNCSLLPGMVATMACFKRVSHMRVPREYQHAARMLSRR